MRIQAHVSEAYRGLVSQAVLDGRPLEVARQEAAEQLAKQTGQTVDTFLKDENLKSISYGFTGDELGRAAAKKHLTAAAHFFGVGIDELKGNLEQLMAKAAGYSETLNRIRSFAMDPGLDPVDCRMVMAMELFADLNKAQDKKKLDAQFR